MNRRIVLSILAVVIPLGWYIIHTVFIDVGEPINLEQSAEQILVDVEKVKNQEKAYTWIASSEIESGYLDQHIVDITKRHRDPEFVVQYLFGTLILEDVELFVQAFQSGTLSEDLFSVDNPDKIEVANEMMDMITRNGLLERVGIINVSGSIGSVVTVRISLGYSDGKEVKVPLKMEMYGDAHSDGNSIYYITTSVWDIIEAIH